MSTGDQMCHCGRWVANHKDGKPCEPFTRLQCSICGWYTDGYDGRLSQPPKYDKCPKCGQSFTWSWKEEKIEYKNRPTTVDVIAIDAPPACIRTIYIPRILLIKRVNDPFKDHWAIPGGFINYDEELEDAAAREFNEETGLVTSASSLNLLGVYSKVNRDERHCISHVYYTHAFTGELKAGDDAKETKWFFIEEVEKMTLAFDHSEIIRDLVIRKEW